MDAAVRISIGTDAAYVATGATAVTAVLLRSGATRWVFQASPITAFSGTPLLLAGGAVLCVGGMTSNRLYGVSAADGALLWAVAVPGGIVAAAAVSTSGVLYAGCLGGGLVALTTVDHFQTAPAEQWMYAAGGDIEAAPAVGASTVYIGSNDGFLHAVRADGTLAWMHAVGNGIQTPTIAADGTVYVSSDDGCCRGLSGSTGALAWALCSDVLSFSAAAIASSGVLLLAAIDQVAATCSLLALRPPGTAPDWVYAADCALLPTVGTLPQPAVDSEGTVYAGFHDGRHHALDPSGVLAYAFGVVFDVEAASGTFIAANGTALTALVTFGQGVLYALA